MSAAQASKRIDAHMVAAGKFHDIDFARLELLGLLAEHPQIRTTVACGYDDTERLSQCRFLITYTCDLVPSPAQLAAIRDWLAGGGKWLALHGTNSLLRFVEAGVECPDERPEVMELLGTRFLAHPPIGPFRVEVANREHELTRGIRRLRGGRRALPVANHCSDRGAAADSLFRPGAGLRRGRVARCGRPDPLHPRPGRQGNRVQHAGPLPRPIRPRRNRRRALSSPRKGAPGPTRSTTNCFGAESRGRCAAKGGRQLDLDFTAAELAFRDEIRELLAAQLPERLREGARRTPGVFVEPDIGLE